MRRRSSSRCSRKLMAVMGSLCSPSGGTVAAISGIGSLKRRLGIVFESFGFRFRGGRGCIDRTFGVAAACYGPFRRPYRRQNLRTRFPIEGGDLRLDLRPEFVAGTLELVQRLANLPSNFRQLLG